MSTPAAPAARLPPIVPPLAQNESVRMTAEISYTKEPAVAFLTSHRVMVIMRSTPGVLTVGVPISLITGLNVSAPKSPQIMMRIAYQPPTEIKTTVGDIHKTIAESLERAKNQPVNQPPAQPQPAAPSTPAAAEPAKPAEPVTKYIVLTFVSENAADQRQKWKDAVTAIQQTNATNAANAAAAAQQAAEASKSPKAADKPSARSPTANESNKQTSAVAVISLATLEARAALLARNPELKQLHTDLVDRSIISEEEFWSSPVHLSMIHRELESQQSSSQKRGLSSLLTAELAPTGQSNDGSSSSLHFQIDANVKHSIFLHSPAVHVAYQKLVPTSMSEKEFWTKYFTSRYVRAASGSSVTEANESDVSIDEFERTMQSANQTIQDSEGRTLNASAGHTVKAVIASKHIDPSVDLTSSDADNAVMSGVPSILDRDQSISAAARVVKRSKKAQSQLDNIRRMNRHGMMLIDSALHSGISQPSIAQPAPLPSNALQQRMDEEEKYHTGLNDSLTLHDLQKENEPTFTVLPIQQKGFLDIQQAKRPPAVTPAPQSTDPSQSTINVKQEDAEIIDPAAQRAALSKVIDEARSISYLKLDRSYLPTSTLSSTIVQNVSLNSRAMNRAAMLTQQINARQSVSGIDDGADENGMSDDVALGSDDVAEVSNVFGLSRRRAALPAPVIFSSVDLSETPVPIEFQNQLRNHFLRAQELQRHFYACFPITPKSSNKLDRIKLALDHSYQSLLNLRSDLTNQRRTVFTPLLTPIMQSIEQCLSTYNKQKEKEKAMRARAQPPAAKRMKV